MAPFRSLVSLLPWGGGPSISWRNSRSSWRVDLNSLVEWWRSLVHRSEIIEHIKLRLANRITFCYWKASGSNNLPSMIITQYEPESDIFSEYTPWRIDLPFLGSTILDESWKRLYHAHTRPIINSGQGGWCA